MNQEKLNKLLKPWRIGVTGICFLIFGVGGLLISLCLNAIYLLSPRGKSTALSRLIISIAFRIYIILLKRLGLLTYDIIGSENLQQDGMLIVANHPSLLDVVFLISLVRNANCIVKESLWYNPLTFGAVSVANYIKNNSQNLLQECNNTLNSSASLVIFPEGTRTQPGKPLKFQRGAANIALSTGKEITPVFINCSPTTLTKGEKWYQVPVRPPRYTVHVLPPILPDDIISSGAMQSKAARELTRYMEALFTREDLRHQQAYLKK